MATGGEYVDECGLCLGPYNNPTFLPCHHTFCAACIQSLADQHPAGAFLCPCCRKFTTLPPGGVSSLPSNFYIKGSRKKESTKCATHQDQMLKFSCVPCSSVICTDCKLTRHEGHATQDLQGVVDRLKNELTCQRRSFRSAEDETRNKIEAIQSQKRIVQVRQSEAEMAIHVRFHTLVTEAGKARDDALASLRSLSDDVVSKIDADLKKQDEDRQQLLNIQQNLQHTVNEGTDDDVIALARVTKNGAVEAVKRLTSEPVRVYNCPLVKGLVTEEDMSKSIRKLFGSVALSNLAEAEVKVEKKFNSGESPDTRVFSLCHVDCENPSLWVSYERYGQCQDAPEKNQEQKRQDVSPKTQDVPNVNQYDPQKSQDAQAVIPEMNEDVPQKKFREGGQFVANDNRVGKVTSKRHSKGRCMTTVPMADGLRTFTKSLTAAHYRLENDFAGRATLEKVTVRSLDPFKTTHSLEFRLKVGPHRAVDVDESEQVFVVVEEPQAPDVRRKVLMYRRPSPDPDSPRKVVAILVSTYRPQHFFYHVTCRRSVSSTRAQWYDTSFPKMPEWFRSPSGRVIN